MYEHYKKARNKAWETLLRAEITSLPVDLGKIADAYHIKVILYSRMDMPRFFPKEVCSGDGFVLENGTKKQIFINDNIHTRPRRRFTLAHELGHAILDHDLGYIHFRNSETDSSTNPQELEANVFARNVLMPAAVLAALDIHTPKEIVTLCHVSIQSAEIRAARLEKLYQRHKFGQHPLEQQVLQNFENFIRNFHK